PKPGQGALKYMQAHRQERLSIGGTPSASASGEERARSFLDFRVCDECISRDPTPVRPPDAITAMQPARNALELRRRSQTLPSRLIREFVQRRRTEPIRGRFGREVK